MLSSILSSYMASVVLHTVPGAKIRTLNYFGQKNGFQETSHELEYIHMGIIPILPRRKEVYTAFLTFPRSYSSQFNTRHVIWARYVKPLHSQVPGLTSFISTR